MSPRFIDFASATSHPMDLTFEAGALRLTCIQDTFTPDRLPGDDQLRSTRFPHDQGRNGKSLDNHQLAIDIDPNRPCDNVRMPAGASPFYQSSFESALGFAAATGRNHGELVRSNLGRRAVHKELWFANTNPPFTNISFSSLNLRLEFICHFQFILQNIVQPIPQ
jgi:hypothetical protein